MYIFLEISTILGVRSHALYVDTRQSALHVGQPRAGISCRFFFSNIYYSWRAESRSICWHMAKCPSCRPTRAGNTGILCRLFFQISIILGVRSHALYVDTRQSAHHQPTSCRCCPTQSMIYVHCLVARLQKIVWFIVQYKHQKSCAEDQMLQDWILRTRSCGTGFCTHLGWLVHFRHVNMIRWKCSVQLRFQLLKGISAGLAFNRFYTNRMVGRTQNCQIFSFFFRNIFLSKCRVMLCVLMIYV